jgi:preprotein translocase subunit SecG
VSSGAGTVSGADVTDVAVTCTDIPYTIGGTVSGLAGTVVLQNNAGDDLSVSADGSFTFDTSLTHGDAYAVTVLTHPGGQVCTVSNGSGTVNAANIANVSVTCVTPIVPYTIGGTVSGLTGTVVLQNNGGDNLSVSAAGGFTFGTALTDGSAYAVTVLTQPSGQVCTVSSGSGTVNAANVGNVAVTCANLYSVGGTISGLTGTVVLQNNGGNNLSVSAAGGFAFSTKLSSGSAYAVTVLTQPTGQTCTVSSGSGTISGANVTGVSVTCTDTPYSVGGAVSGLTGTVVLQNNAGDNLSVSADGGFTFVTTLANNAAYTVTVSTQPVGQTCVVSNGSGTVNAANVTNVAVTCSDIPYTIGGTVTGLTGTVVLQNNAGDDLTVLADGGFTFATTLVDSATYAVTVLTQPAGQICTVSSGSGTISGANVTGVTVTCAAAYTIGGTVTGLTGTVVLQNNAGDDLSVSADGGFTFATGLVNSATYAVTVLTQPSGQVCTVSSGSGTVSAANVSNVAVTCATAYDIGGTVTGLTGTVVLQNNAGDDLSVSADGSFTFATSVLSGGAYAVTVLTQPVGQTCTVSSGSGTVSGADVTNVAVDCASVLTLGVTLNPDRARPGEGLTASIRLGNTDAAAVDNVKLRATVPATGVNGTNINGYVSGATCSASPCVAGALITWNIGSLGGGESTVVSVPLVVNSSTTDGTVITLPVEVLVDGTQALSTSAAVTVSTANALSLALDGDQDTVAPDDTLIYTLT